MLNTTIEEAFEINPTITIKRDAEVPFVSMDRLTPGQRDVDAGEIRQFRSGSKFAAGDTLMARITPCLENKKIARYLPNDNFNKIAAGSTEFIVLRGKPGITTTEFSYYFAITPTIHETAIALMTGTSGRQRVDMTAFRAQEVEIPKLAEQRKITDLLGALDDKISTNVRIINATDSLVDVLYSRVIKTPTEQSFAEVAQVFGGSTPSTKNDAFWDGDINWATPTDITALDGPWIGDTSRKITEAGLASMSSSLHPENSILMTSRATIGAIALASGPITTNQGFIVVEAPDELTPWLFAQMKARKHEFEAWANGATFMELSRGNFKKLPFIGCSDDDLQAFNDAAWPLLKRAQAAQKENQVLARTRDELLPLLMSGRITVGEAEKAANVADTAASES
ncbi:restriction endonuclease subunit S [Corynebacterium striatum]|uniref:restriction endonuclease subunit S n=1 Tax=Corynebacterium striatum TaxID=43770 RepID=UPI0014194E1E|nr:restriction endonuclease subunit S [Corynebacterium striatum]NHY10757.1 restriction endonuclease subunit S [Corynebacterium striatum]NHY35084.1 restriction endonuclease subunit S [Corynebacterium striatum]HAT1131599.1 restriction endonuclease subunit S [Corynebacterium striatum]HAT1139660.1 restriction endonuclease subunit S [Corynebacterium striatum]HAT1142606.1 restriction endonuclease subunit S [Corynebacterium striatum]